MKRRELCRVCRRSMPVAAGGRMRDHSRTAKVNGTELSVKCRGAWYLYPGAWEDDDAKDEQSAMEGLSAVQAAQERRLRPVGPRPVGGPAPAWEETPGG